MTSKNGIELLLRTGSILAACAVLVTSVQSQASTTGIDPDLYNALTNTSTAPVIVGQVTSNTADSNGQRNLDVLKVIQAKDPASPYKYLGAYHRQTGSSPTQVGLVGSNDLVQWSIINASLDGDYSSQPDITKLSDNSYLVIYENTPSAYDSSRSADPTFRIRHYPSYSSLASGTPDRQFDFSNTLSSTHCAEGTPNFRRVSYSGNIDDSQIELGFHYCNFDSAGHVSATAGVPDSVARGLLTNFRLWKGQDFTSLNQAMRASGVRQVGQMSTLQYQGNTYTVLEGQSNFDDFGSFKLYIYNEDSGFLQPLNVSTPGGSYSVANPRVSVHYNNSGVPDGVIGSYALLYANSPQCFYNGSNHCAGVGEGGTFLFKQNLSGSLSDGSAAYTPFSFTYYPVASICNTGCQGVLRANGDLNVGSNAASELGGVITRAGWGGGHMLYGPYWTSLPPLPLTASFKMQVDFVGNPGERVATIEAVDATTGTIIASKDVYRGSFHHAYVYSDLLLAFDWNGRQGHQVEFRVFSHNISYMKVASVSVLQRDYTFNCPGALQSTSISYNTGASCASSSPSSNGNLVYGPYFSDFPGVPSTANFSIRASQLSVSGGTAVGTIDVHAYNASGQGVVLASANLPANQLTANYRDFALSYDPTLYIANGWYIETRVHGLGRGVLDTRSTRVSPNP